MKKFATLALLAALVIALAVCSEQKSADPKNTNLGTIEVSGGKPSCRMLADGRVLTVMPTLLGDGRFKVSFSVPETNVSGKRSSRRLVVYAPGWIAGQSCIFSIDKDALVTLTLHVSE